jgi:hypothetical protein
MKADELATVKFSIRLTTSPTESLAADIVSRMSAKEFTGYNLKSLGASSNFSRGVLDTTPLLMPLCDASYMSIVKSALIKWLACRRIFKVTVKLCL